MQKDFDAWIIEKKKVDKKETGRYYRERELWWCNVGVNVGSETDGRGTGFRRPVLVLKGLSRDICLIVPLTTSKRAHQYRLPIGMIAGKDAHALVSQIRVIDTRRLIRKMRRLDGTRFELVRRTVRELL